MYRIEIWKQKELLEVFEAEDIQEILAWYKWYWYDAYSRSLYMFYVYKDGIEFQFEELEKLGFYN